MPLYYSDGGEYEGLPYDLDKTMARIETNVLQLAREVGRVGEAEACLEQIRDMAHQIAERRYKA